MCDYVATRRGSMRRHQKTHRQAPSLRPPVPPGVRGEDVPDEPPPNAYGRAAIPVRPCRKAFLERSHLIDHQTTHTGEKPLRCTPGSR
ncbi:hypothetical protein ISCGN_024490 [Ixodes scapularis]